MHIEFLEGAAARHPNFERYMDESTAEGSVPLRFDCAATAGTAEEEICCRALEELERRAQDDEADILPSTVVATRIEEPSGHRRFRVMAIARLRRLVVERTVVAVDDA